MRAAVVVLIVVLIGAGLYLVLHAFPSEESPPTSNTAEAVDTSSSTGGTEQYNTTSAPNDQDPLLITTIKRRDEVIHIYTGQRFTVESTQGEMLANLISESQFEQQFPDLFHSLQTMYAPDYFIDASSRRGPIITRSRILSEGQLRWADEYSD